MPYDFLSDKPIFLQIAEIIKNQIVSGELKAGDRLKSVREYSAEFVANPNTVQKALQQLEQEGLIFTDRTNGKFVADDKILILKTKNKEINSKVVKFISEMQAFGYDKKEIVSIINNWENN